MNRILLLLVLLPFVGICQDESGKPASKIEAFPADKNHIVQTTVLLLDTIWSEKKDVIRIERVSKKDLTNQQVITGLKISFIPSGKAEVKEVMYVDSDDFAHIAKSIDLLLREDVRKTVGANDDLKINLSKGAIGYKNDLLLGACYYLAIGKEDKWNTAVVAKPGLEKLARHLR